MFARLFVPNRFGRQWHITGGRRRLSTIQEEDPGNDNIARTLEDDCDPVLLECEEAPRSEVRDGS